MGSAAAHPIWWMIIKRAVLAAKAGVKNPLFVAGEFLLQVGPAPVAMPVFGLSLMPSGWTSMDFSFFLLSSASRLLAGLSWINDGWIKKSSTDFGFCFAFLTAGPHTVTSALKVIG